MARSWVAQLAPSQLLQMRRSSANATFSITVITSSPILSPAPHHAEPCAFNLHWFFLCCCSVQDPVVFSFVGQLWPDSRCSFASPLICASPPDAEPTPRKLVFSMP